MTIGKLYIAYVDNFVCTGTRIPLHFKVPGRTIALNDQLIFEKMPYGIIISLLLRSNFLNNETAPGDCNA